MSIMENVTNPGSPRLEKQVNKTHPGGCHRAHLHISFTLLLPYAESGRLHYANGIQFECHEMTDAKPKKSKSAAFGFFITLVLSALGGYWISSFVFKVPGLKAALPAFNAFDAFAFLFLVLLVLAIHELGHLMGAFSRGMKFLLFVVGPFQWIRTADGIRFSLVFNLGNFGGLAAALPNPDQAMAPQLKRLVIGGPLSSLLLSIFCMLIGMMTLGQARVVFLFCRRFFLSYFSGNGIAIPCRRLHERRHAVA